MNALANMVRLTRAGAVIAWSGARVFPDMFYMQERGRNYFNRTTDRGRYLDAGYHSILGYFRDDQALYEYVHTLIKLRFPGTDRPVVDLDVEDRWPRGDPELVRRVLKSLRPHLGAPQQKGDGRH